MEEIRKKNMEEIKKMFGDIFTQSQEEINSLIKESNAINSTTKIKPAVKRKRRTIQLPTSPVRKSRRISKNPPLKYNNLDTGVEEDSGDEDYEDEEDYEKFTVRRRRTIRIVHRTPAVENFREPHEITEEEFANIAQSSTTKTYSKEHGTTCHQCRQKTLDTKTICRSGVCHGARGMFCGPCLNNRYGESVADALRDPNWACPPCRNMCNCSICRNREGKLPTGILFPIVQEKGYYSVKEFLEQIGDTSKDKTGYSYLSFNLNLEIYDIIQEMLKKRETKFIACHSEYDLLGYQKGTLVISAKQRINNEIYQVLNSMLSYKHFNAKIDNEMTIGFETTTHKLVNHSEINKETLTEDTDGLVNHSEIDKETATENTDELVHHSEINKETATENTDELVHHSEINKKTATENIDELVNHSEISKETANENTDELVNHSEINKKIAIENTDELINHSEINEEIAT